MGNRREKDKLGLVEKETQVGTKWVTDWEGS